VQVGAIKDGVIEIQGDHANLLMTELKNAVLPSNERVDKKEGSK
jgi:translation initiation factor 1 (eIF-1/SUI1)